MAGIVARPSALEIRELRTAAAAFPHPRKLRSFPNARIGTATMANARATATLGA